MKFFKVRWKEICLVIIVIFVIIPGLFALIFSQEFIITDTSNDWIGFWGSYIGAIIGGAITLVVLYMTLDANKKERIQNEKARFYDGIIRDIADFDLCLKNMIEALKDGNNKNFDTIKIFNQKALLIKLKFEIENEKGIHRNIENVIKLLNDLLNCADEVSEKIQGDIFGDEDYKMDCKMELLKLRLCTDGFIKETKDMIVKNALN